MIAPDRPPMPRPSVPLLTVLVGIGAGVWVAAFINAGVAAFLVAIVSGAVCLLVGVAIGDAVAEQRHQRRDEEMQNYYASAWNQAQHAQVSAAQTTRQLKKVESELRDAHAEIARLRAEQEAATVKEGDPQ